VKVFFDNCTAPWLASTLNGYIAHLGHNAYHIMDVPGLPKGRHSDDVDWLEHLRRQKDWIFITGDFQLLKNKAERAALRASGLHGFILATGYQKMPDHHVASNLVWKWPEIETVTNALGPSIFQIPVSRSAKLSTLPL
jgi:hypothetical protein